MWHILASPAIGDILNKAGMIRRVEPGGWREEYINRRITVLVSPLGDDYVMGHDCRGTAASALSIGSNGI